MTNEQAAKHLMVNHSNRTLDRSSVQMILLGELFYLCTIAEVDALLENMYRNGMLTKVGSNPFPCRNVYIVNTNY